MVNIKNNVISLDFMNNKKTKRLSARQLSNLNKLSNNDKNLYMLSLLGIKNKVTIPRYKHKYLNHDSLNKRPGSILFQMRQIKDLDHNHKPSHNNVGHWIGIEIECIIPHQDGDGGECNCEYDAGGDLESECNWCMEGQPDNWGEERAHRWLRKRLEMAGVHRVQVKEDGSLDDADGHGVECTILFNTAKGFEPLEKLCKALKDNGCYVNDTCGMHVHLDARHLTEAKAKRVGDSFGYALPVLKWVVAPSRHKNQYCKLAVSKMIRASHDLETWDERYHAINLTSYFKYNTIEIRMHQGSLNAKKIKNWVQLLKVISNSKLRQFVTSFQDFIDIKGMNDELIDYAEKRILELHYDDSEIILDCKAG